MTNCINCGFTEFLSGPVDRSTLWAQIAMRTCEQCALAQLSEWNKDFQPDLYRYYGEWSGLQIQEAYSALNAQRHVETLEALSRLTPGRRLLDVGCGTGHFVESACQLGWQAKGVDLAADAIRLAQTRGIPCSTTDFLELSSAGGTYDLISMSEFIEHVPYPGRYISHAETLLASDGVLYLTTPNLNSLTRRLAGDHWPVFHPEHLSYFCPRSLKFLLSSHCPSLKITNFETRNFSIAPVASRAKAVLGRWSAQLRNGSGHVSSERSANKTQSRPTVDQSVRSAVNSLQLLSKAKVKVNAALSLCGAGDTLIAISQKS